MSDRGPPLEPAAEESKPLFDVHPTVFFTSAGLILLFVILGLVFPDRAQEVFEKLKDSVTHFAGWFFILAANIFLAFCLYIIFSRHGRVRLGGKHTRPEFSYPSWLAMLFSAGMGIGLVFWSVAEPVFHLSTPADIGIEPASPEAARAAMALTYFHWGLHAWGIYGLVGLTLAYFAFNRGLPLTIRSAFYPLIGERIHGPIGNLIDIVAVVATLFGVATSLGFGVQQVNAGLHYVFDIPFNTGMQALLIAIITAMATVSVVLGLDKGIRRLSEINIGAAAILLLFVLLLGPTLYLLNSVVQNIGEYLQRFLYLSTWTDTYQESGWRETWTIFYWAWWIAWSPFVGMFIARVSKGRTIREFLVGVLFVPTALTFVWLSIFGNAALFEQLHNANTVVADAVNENIATSLFALMGQFPLSSITSLVGVFVVVVFFVTSSDSGSLVIDIITAGGNTDPPVLQRIFWAVLEGVVAAVLLLVGGDQSLQALQTATITTGLPFAIVLLFGAYALLKDLRRRLPHRVPPS